MLSLICDTEGEEPLPAFDVLDNKIFANAK